MISTQAKVVGGSYSITSMTASALRPWRSKCSRWRSPLPLPMGPGTTETQLGSHSAIRLGSEMRSKTSWMETPTVPVYVRETGRMEIRYDGGGWWRMVEDAVAGVLQLPPQPS